MSEDWYPELRVTSVTRQAEYYKPENPNFRLETVLPKHSIWALESRN